ncbi:MAG: GTP-binding protein Obg [Acidobacteriales bacterium]|nr:GTP-binding protein Obg [Terriglobales bacterium]
MFIDEARIRVYAGGGGNGCMAFRREKFVPRGGPSGGDGGRGGDIVMESSERHNTLVHFRFNPEYKAQRGRHGEGSNCTGKDGEGIVLKVPVGTIVYDDVTGAVVHDFSRPDDRMIIARGGRGGRGNQHFATATHQAPQEHEAGRPGEERMLRLELKLLADVGLVGYPNVGKSTLISRISAARPKIADYEFTTLQPNLGVVTIGEMPDQESYVVADIPGLIEGAHEGHGLGVQFLRHIERTRLLVHLVDVSDASGRPDPVKDFEVIMAELSSFGAGLDEKPMIVAGAKIDVANKEKLAKLQKYCDKRGYPFIGISAVSGENINKLKWQVGAIVRQMRQGSYEGPKPKSLRLRGSEVAKPAVKKAVAKKAVAKKKVAKAPAKKAANQQKSANKRVSQSRRAQTARPSAGRKKATAARPKKKLSGKQRARR